MPKRELEDPTLPESKKTKLNDTYVSTFGFHEKESKGTENTSK